MLKITLFIICFFRFYLFLNNKNDIKPLFLCGFIKYYFYQNIFFVDKKKTILPSLSSD